MNEKENISYARILKYINEHPNMPINKKKFLLAYAFKLKINNIENIENESINDIKQALNVLEKEMHEFEKTSIAQKRKELIQSIAKDLEKDCLTHTEINKISLKIDMLYMLLDLPLRKNSGLAYHLKIRGNHNAKK